MFHVKHLLRFFVWTHLPAGRHGVPVREIAQFTTKFTKDTKFKK